MPDATVDGPTPAQHDAMVRKILTWGFQKCATADEVTEVLGALGLNPVAYQVRRDA